MMKRGENNDEKEVRILLRVQELEDEWFDVEGYADADR
jgi:hypothetical protein